MRIRIPSLPLIIMAVTLTLSGCAAMQKSDATQTEQELAAAGFKMKLANTPDKLAHLKTLTQLKVVPHEQEGKVRYVYADAKYCECVYAGDEVAFEKYQKIAINQRIAMENQNARMNWGVWGGYGWGW